MITATANGLSATVVTHADDLRRLELTWRAILEDSSANEPTLSPEWVLTWWEVYGGDRGRRLRCLRMDEGGEPIGLALFSMRTHWYAPAIPFRRLEMLGSGEREVDSVCSDYLNLIARRGHEAEVARRFAEALARGEMGGWDEVVIPLMDGDSVLPHLLRGEALRAVGMLPARRQRERRTSRCPLPGKPILKPWTRRTVTSSHGRYATSTPGRGATRSSTTPAMRRAWHAAAKYCTRCIRNAGAKAAVPFAHRCFSPFTIASCPRCWHVERWICSG